MYLNEADNLNPNRDGEEKQRLPDTNMEICQKTACVSAGSNGSFSPSRLKEKKYGQTFAVHLHCGKRWKTDWGCTHDSKETQDWMVKDQDGKSSDSSAGPKTAGAGEKCDVSWDEVTLKEKAQGFVWSQVTQLHVCLAGIYQSGKSLHTSCCFRHSLDWALSLQCEMVESSSSVWRQRWRKKEASKKKLVSGGNIWPE